LKSTGRTEETNVLALDEAPDGAPQGVELRHLRYFVAVADAGTFTHAAQRMYVAQPTLSQQIRRLEDTVGTPLLQRRRDGIRLTEVGTVLLEESRTLLSVLDRGLSRTRQAAGLERPRLRFVVPPYLPVTLAVETASRLRAAAADTGVDVAWMETVLDAEFSAIRQRRADAGLGWLTFPRGRVPAPLDVMELGEFEPDVWIPSPQRARRGPIGLDELAAMDVIHGPRRISPATYDNWLAVLPFARPGVGAVTLALLFGFFALIYGVSQIILGVETRRTGKTLDSVLENQPA
jgi:DNA-binding transcriptional LysR family regulator